MSRVGIRHLSFTLGDQKVWYRDLPDIEKRIQRLEIPDEEDLWNWGFCRRSSGDYSTHVAGGFAELIAYLVATGIKVDAVLGCGPFQNSADHFVSALESEVLPKIAVSRNRFHLIEDRECVNVLQALEDARKLLHSGHEHVLVLAAEKVEDEGRRFRKYSLFSDFCLALLLSTDLEHCAYEVRDVLIQADPAPGEDTSGILGRNLERDCVASVLAANRLSIGEVAKFFYLNLFEPIAEMKGKETGFERSQLYTDLTKEIAHCYGADPIINMHMYLAGRSDGGTHLICASGREYAGVSIVRPLREETC